MRGACTVADRGKHYVTRRLEWKRSAVAVAVSVSVVVTVAGRALRRKRGAQRRALGAAQRGMRGAEGSGGARQHTWDARGCSLDYTGLRPVLRRAAASATRGCRAAGSRAAESGVGGGRQRTGAREAGDE